MKRMLLIGKIGSGKTTLINTLLFDKKESEKTQALDFFDMFIDTPGEYLEIRSMYKALIVTAAEADAIGIVQACGDADVRVPPMFASTFAKEVVGIVTKTDLAGTPEDIGVVREILTGAGVSRIFEVSSFSGDGLADLAEFITKE